LPVLFTLTLTLNSEPKISEHKPLDWQEAWQSLFANRPLRRLLLADLLMGIQGGINGSVHFFFVIHVLKLPTSASIFLVAIWRTSHAVFWRTPIIRSNRNVPFCAGTELLASLGSIYDGGH
jgi:Na+/melibiose symporter-like transporter